MDISVRKYGVWHLLSYAVLLCTLIYFSFFFDWNTGTVDEQRREINGWFRLWANGHLSVLLNAKYSGPFCLLVLPAWLHLWKKGEKAGCVFFVFSLVLIGARGFINYRYAYTVFPLMLFVTGLVFFENSTEGKKLFFSAVIIFLHTLFFVSSDMAPKYLHRVKEALSAPKPDVFSYIRQRKGMDHQVFLVNNLPEFYYRCRAKGYFYMSNDDYYFSAEGKKDLFGKDYTPNALQSLGITYIISDTVLNKYNLRFDAFLKKYATPEYRDGRGRILYRLKE